MTDRRIPEYVLMLWGGQLDGCAPRTTVFETFYNRNGALYGRRVGTKIWRKIDADNIVAEFATIAHPSKFLVRQAKKMFHANWRRNTVNENTRD